MSDLPLVSPGDKLPRSAGTFNEFTKAARQAKQHDIGTPPPSNLPTAQQSTIQVYNDTGTDITEQYAVVGLLDPVFLPELDDNALRTFKQTPCFNIEYPATAATAGRYAILQQPLSDGRIGIAVLDGKTVGIVDSRTEIGMAVEATAASSDEMLSPSVYGNATVLWKGDADGLPENAQIALLRVGNAPRRDGVILVQNNYPFRLPKLCVVGIDHPIIPHRITDADSFLRFIDEETIYSCMSAQARHRNRIAILQQELMPGEWGYAVYQGITRAVFIQAIGPNAGAAQAGTFSSTTTTSHAITAPYGESEERNLPWINHESSGDHHRHLGIPGARYGGSGNAPGAEYDLDGTVWGSRRRPKWLFPIVDGERERALIQNPYENAQLMTSHGRATAIAGYPVPEITSAGTSNFVCSGGAWVQTSSTCGEGTSSLMFPEYAPYSTISGMSTRFALPCTENATETSVPCLQTIPATDNDMYDVMGTAIDWSYAINATPDDSLRTRWLIGNVALGNPSDNSQYTGPFDPTDAIGSSPNFDREHNYEPCFFPSTDTFPEVGTTEYIERIRQCCSTITCTYERDGSSLARFSPTGAGIYRLAYMGTAADPYSGPIDCVCPDAFVADRLSYEFANLAMPEITLGMIYSSTTTTTTTTSTTSSTTTTTVIGSCCKFGVNLEYVGCDDSVTLTQCTATIGGMVNSVEWSNGGTCDGMCAEAVCLPNIGTCDEYKVGGGFIGGLYEPQGAGTTCGTVTCPTTTSSTSTSTSSSSSTTSSTTTTSEEGSSSSTTSSSTSTSEEGSSSSSTSSSTTTSEEGSSSSSTTTTTAEPTGACCVDMSASVSCSIQSASACSASMGTYHGDGSVCAGIDCGGACCVGDACVLAADSFDCVFNKFGTYLGDGVGCSGGTSCE